MEQNALDALQEDFAIMLMNARKNKMDGKEFGSYVLYATMGLLMKIRPNDFEEIIEQSLNAASFAHEEMKKGKE